MDSEYRKELKRHLMKSFQTNRIERSLQTPTTDFMSTLVPSSINIQSSTSRTIQALLDDSYSSGTSERQYERDEDEITVNQCQQHSSCQPSQSKLRNANVREAQRINDKNRAFGGENNDETYPANFPSNQTICTRTSGTHSKSTTFKRRTSRELRNMVKNQCKIAESLNMIENSNDNNARMPPSMLLWKSKRNFNSSVDLHSDILLRSDPSSLNLLEPSHTSTPTSEQFFTATCDKLPNFNAERIVRDQFTGPLIREVERVYVQNITTTADLLKKLDCMPGDIDKALAKRHKLYSSP